MEWYTIPEPIAGRFQPHFNFGGRGFWCMFDYAVRPAPSVSGVGVEIARAADAATVEWFPHVKRGMEAGVRLLREHYWRSLTGVLVEVVKVHTHPVDTVVAGCERYGSTFIVELGLFRASPTAVGGEPSQAEPAAAPPRRPSRLVGQPATAPCRSGEFVVRQKAEASYGETSCRGRMPRFGGGVGCGRG